MSVIKSPYFLLAKLKAKYLLEKNKKNIGTLIKFRHAKQVQKFNKLKILYNFIPENHEKHFSAHAIAKSNGCGCAYCVALHEYAYAKLNLHYLKKSFESEFDTEWFNNSNHSIFSTSNNFYALYSEHSSKVTKENQLSYIEFFNKIKAERKEKIKALRIEYQSIKEGIHTVLSS